jgi:DNA-binding transcriptional LysR family regulator
MTLRQMEYVLAVAETRSFTRAAQRLHVSQPSLSQQIQALELELGGPLVERPPGPVRLTPAGRAFVAEARVALSSSGRAADAARRAMRMQTGRLELATVRSLAVSMLPPCIRTWHETYPGVVIHLHEHGHAALVEDAVRDGAVEVGVGPRPPAWSGVVKRLGWDELVAVLPLQDPLLRSGAPVPLGALADRDWVVFEPGHGLADYVARACAHAGFAPRGVVTTAQVDAAARLAAAGVGPALVPAKTVPGELRDELRRLDPPVVWPLAAFGAGPAWSPLAGAFVDVLAGGEWLRRRPPGALVLEQGPAPA